jgi:cytochrome c biogenesis protein CcmG/thiol:disulfide interchange protein DsbE
VSPQKQKSSRPRPPQPPAPKTPSGGNAPPPRRRSGTGAYIGLTVAAVVVVIAVVAVLVTRSSGGDSGAGPQTYPVQVTGTPLPDMPDAPAADPGIGQPAPTLTGQSLFDGTPLTITPGGGQPQLLVFVAHWCPHCQREVPVLVNWMASGQKPAGLNVVAVSTANDASDVNSPASAWLQRENWPTPVMADSGSNTAADAYGLPSYPYLVVVGPDGTVKARTSGELTPDELTSFVTKALA